MLSTTCLLMVYGVCYSIDNLWEKYLDVNGVNSETLKPMSSTIPVADDLGVMLNHTSHRVIIA